MTPWFEKQFLFVTGKGGVGKTTVSAALALKAAQKGKRVLLAMCQAKERLSTMLEIPPIGTSHVSVGPNLDVVNVNPFVALEEYGEMILKSKRLTKLVLGNAYIHDFLHGTPGIDAWATLGKAYFHATYTGKKKHLQYDLVIVDGPATGHALEMLRVPKVISDVAPPGLLKREARAALELFRDQTRSSVMLVTLLEDLPIKETFELHDALRNQLSFNVNEIVVNQYLEPVFSEGERIDWMDRFQQLQAQKQPNQQIDFAGFYRVCKIQMMKVQAQQMYLEVLREGTSADLFLLPLIAKPRLQRLELEGFAQKFG